MFIQIQEVREYLEVEPYIVIQLQLLVNFQNLRCGVKTHLNSRILEI